MITATRERMARYVTFAYALRVSVYVKGASVVTGTLVSDILTFGPNVYVYKDTWHRGCVPKDPHCYSHTYIHTYTYTYILIYIYIFHFVALLL